MIELEIDSRVPLEPTAHGEVEFVHFGVRGLEVLRSGYIWAQALPVKGMRCFWVLPALPPAEEGAPCAVPRSAVAVVRASRRHRVGLETDTARGGHWRRSAGRYVDVGTFYSETHPNSPTGSLTASQRSSAYRRTAIHVPALADWEFALLSGEGDPGLLQ